jgi:alanyl-tRNA synthetase
VGASAQHVGGGGGGRPTLAQAGGPDADGISAAIEAFEDLVRETLED